MSESFLNGKVTLHRGDCLEVLPLLDADSIDSCVTDPPYGIHFMGKSWDKFGGPTGKDNTTHSKRGGAMHAGTYDLSLKGMKGFQDFTHAWASAAIRVLKPGGHILCFASTRTYHRMACAIEDAGFEIRDQIGWCYGSGFPKSHDVSKGIDRLAGAEREIVARVAGMGKQNPEWNGTAQGRAKNSFEPEYNLTAPATESAIQWQGWGTALKPAWEPIVLARKPLSESSIAANVLKHGTGGINVDGCRVAHDEPIKPMKAQGAVNSIIQQSGRYEETTDSKANGRWPANLIHDGSEEVLAGFPETASGDGSGNGRGALVYGQRDGYAGTNAPGDSGSAARFFYTAKADADDRLGSKHPTVKPLDLMQYLIRLVTPCGGICLDPFAGTGTCGEAALREGFRCVLIEREAEYQADIVKRMGLCLSGPDQRRAASVKQLPPDDLPMFGGKA